MTTEKEIACVYAALVLEDDDVTITSEKISTILKASGVDIEPFWPGLFAKALEGVDVKSLITNISNGVGAATVSSGGAVATAGDSSGESKEEKEDKKDDKKEESEESDEDMGFGLFD